MVRARKGSHLEALTARFPNLLGACEIKSSAGSDYSYRICVAKSAWSYVVASLSEQMDYDNFNTAVARHDGRVDRDYDDALYDVWGVMHQLQNEPPRTLPPHSALKG